MLKLKRIIALCIVASFIWAFSIQAAQAVVVTFPNANLEARVRNALNISAPTEITDTDMARLGSLNAGDRNISSLQGMEYAVNLTYLNLNDNRQLTDISSLSGLTKLKKLYLPRTGITDLSAVSGLTNLQVLYVEDNDWLTDNISAVSELTNLVNLSLGDIPVEILDLRGSNFSSLEYFAVTIPLSWDFAASSNSFKEVLLADAILSQNTFNVIMDGGYDIYGYDIYREYAHGTGVAELNGVLSLDMSGVDFTDISDLSAMYTMDDLEELCLRNATNLDGSDVVTLTNALNSLNWLNVAGLWTSFDAGEQSLLQDWDAIEGNTLITELTPGDANGDGRVDASDATILAGHWQFGVDDERTADWSMGDFNDDGKVDVSDATILAGYWQSGVDNSTTAVPEPATLTMLLVLAALAIRWKKRKIG